MTAELDSIAELNEEVRRLRILLEEKKLEIAQIEKDLNIKNIEIETQTFNFIMQALNDLLSSP